MTDVLADDREATPIKPAAPEGFYCDLCPDRGPFRTKGGLSGHRAAKHGITGESPRAQRRASPAGAGHKPPPGATAKPLASRLEGSFGLIGMGVSFLEPYDGRCVTAGAHNLGLSLGQLAEVYPETRKYIEMLCLDSPALAVVLATLPVLLPIMKHHGIIRIDLPPMFAGPVGTKPGSPPPARDGASPSGPPVPDLAAMLTALGPEVAAAMQAHAAAPRPMGEGAPPAAGTAPPPAPPAADEEPSPAGEGEPA
jgi:hypothetical protein